MTNLRNRTLTILLIVLAFRLNAQDSHQNAEVFPFSEPEQAGVSSYKLNLLKDEINSWIKSGELMGGEVLIIKEEHTIFHESFGWFDKEHGKKMMKGVVYHTASMSKPFSTTLILQLAEQGFLSIDDPVQKYIRNFPNDSVKVQNLMNHTESWTIQKFIRLDNSMDRYGA